jgi:ubiquinone/menaquinone biosynthesis C-methylase UbiE
MEHEDHVNLLKPAALPSGGTWADLGAGTGAFTLALRQLVGPEAEVCAVDRDRSSLRELERNFRGRFGSSEQLHLVEADFTRSLALPPVEGVLMANSLHYYKEKESLLRKVLSLLKPGGLFLLVEYNVDRGNLWVPHPLSFESFRQLAPLAGFSEPRRLATHPSSFLREFYSAVALKDDLAVP